jgi:hypothetical protein
MTANEFRRNAAKEKPRRTLAHAKRVWRDSSVAEQGLLLTLFCFLLCVGFLFLLVPSEADVEKDRATQSRSEFVMADEQTRTDTDAPKPRESDLVRSEN